MWCVSNSCQFSEGILCNWLLPFTWTGVLNLCQSHIKGTDTDYKEIPDLQHTYNGFVTISQCSIWKQLPYSRIIRRPVRATLYNSDIKDICIHTLFCTGGKGWSTTGEISENGAAKEIQSFPSDGAALPRETGNENAALCPQHQAAHTQTCTEKNPLVTRYRASLQQEHSRFGTRVLWVCRTSLWMQYLRQFRRKRPTKKCKV